MARAAGLANAQNGGMRPESTVGALTAAIVAVVIVGALGLAFAALATDDDEPDRPAVVTVRF
jgi:hypothetical protein